MGEAKNIILNPITAQEANELIDRVHYSGKHVRNSQLHIGVYYKGQLEGAMQYGPSLDKRKIVHLVANTKWNEFLELNRLAFTDELPTNSESRALAIASRMIRKHAPHIKWIITFADGTQCGDGTIYRAAGFTLTAINRSKNLVKLPNGEVIHKMTLESSPTTPRPELDGRSYYDVTGGKYDLKRYAETVNGRIIPGYQFRYIHFLDPKTRDNLTVPGIPYADIPDDARMYKGKRVRLK